VSHKGETYWVCCSGCRDAFNENPEKYIKEFQEKKAKGGE
jgi:YHS domain-containing protein